MEEVLKYNKIKSFLSDKRIRNEDLAKFLGKTVNSITKWNSNRAQPPIQELYRIAEFLKLKDWRDLLEKEPYFIKIGRDKEDKK
ncbi:helix-turn-helix transcriptional regulator [Chitinophaga sp. LS1]|uniref:helix-turn-helix transcriptional regulator n=1 Tax=Chitinophaga sp. LS1 TaxID=3051176 RepID=UPI002AABD6D7|nr:helix-turn-helix transcriptional regulator [Chitinophaga sp. LS1]WPV67542.1 helix-turn-helix transcriptional regulator [Chitinophaga sp. LS1]